MSWLPLHMSSRTLAAKKLDKSSLQLKSPNISLHCDLTFYIDAKETQGSTQHFVVSTLTAHYNSTFHLLYKGDLLGLLSIKYL